jgi:CelD/BcsL family acetyltransferase involved in cellulose biosynthesis
MTHPFTIRVVTDSEEFGALAPSWSALMQRAQTGNIFLTHEWLFHWARHYVRRGKDQLWVLLVEDHSGRVRGIAPFYIAHRGRLPLFACREVAFLGSQHVGSMYLDVIAEPRDRRAVVRTLYEYIFRDGRRHWDILSLEQLPAESETIDVLQACLDQDGKAWRIVETGACPTVQLPCSWREYVGRLSANTRYNLQRKLKILEQEGEVAYRHVTKGPEAAAGFETLIRLHEKRWISKDRGGGAFRRPEFLAFHQAFAMLAADKGWLSLSVLLVDQRPIAGIYGFVYEGTYYFYLPGFDPDVAPSASPGMLILARRLEQAIAEGHWHVDLLRGAADYKLSWATGLRRTLSLRAYNRRWPALARYLMEALKESVKLAVR